MSDTLKDDKIHIWHPFTQAKTAPEPIAIKSANGIYLTTEDDKQIVDYISSWWVNIHGHCHPYICDAIYNQSKNLEQVIFAGFTHKPATELSKKLTSVLPDKLNKVFFSDNGSTAVEVGIKMAYQYHINLGAKKTKILTFDGAYHGDTFGAMSAGKSSKFFDNWQDLLFDVEVVPYPHTFINDTDVDNKEQSALNELDNILNNNKDDICAIILEPLVQGAGGMRMVRPSFVKQVCEKVKNAGGLVIFDEVMTGFGRTGTMFASEQSFTPDIICLSKGLTAGFMAMSVTVCSDEIYDAFLDDSFDKSFIHGHSFTANPLGCAAAIASLEVFENEKVMDKISNIENIHKETGIRILSGCKTLTNIRIQGTIIAMDVNIDDTGYKSSIGDRLKKYFWENGALIRPLGNVIYLLPPYVISEEQLTDAYNIIVEAVNEIVGD